MKIQRSAFTFNPQGDLNAKIQDIERRELEEQAHSMPNLVNLLTHYDFVKITHIARFWEMESFGSLPPVEHYMG